jgi:curved DNA-binding protein CbpA
MIDNPEQYYKTLGLEPGASLEEVNQAYKDLAFIWHPDRIPKDNQRLLEKSEAKLKEINQARDRLRLIYQSNNYTQVRKHPSNHPPTSAKHQHHSSEYSHQRPYYKDLRGADLSGANLKEKDLAGRNLQGANLSNADLTDGFLHKVILEGANLYKANLFRANLLQANLKNANLQEANLIGADFSGANLSGADLTGAKIRVGDRVMVKMTGAILSGAIMPDGQIHA